MASKEVLIEILKQTLADRMKYIEKRSQEQIDSLTFTKKEFDSHQKKISSLIKKRIEKEQKDKEEAEKKERERLLKLEKSEKEKSERKRDKSIDPKENGRKTLQPTSIKASPSMANFSNRKTIGNNTDRRGTINSLNTSINSKRASTPGRKTTNIMNNSNKKPGVGFGVSSTANKQQSIHKSSTTAQLNAKNPFATFNNTNTTNKNTRINANSSKSNSTKAEPKAVPKEVPKATFMDIRKSEVFIGILSFLNNYDRLSLFASNKQLFLPDLIALITDYHSKLIENNNILFGQTIDDKIKEIEEVSSINLYLYSYFHSYRHKQVN